jgi:hypothetical protein
MKFRRPSRSWEKRSGSDGSGGETETWPNARLVGTGGANLGEGIVLVGRVPLVSQVV